MCGNGFTGAEYTTESDACTPTVGWVDGRANGVGVGVGPATFPNGVRICGGIGSAFGASIPGVYIGVDILSRIACCCQSDMVRTVLSNWWTRSPNCTKSGVPHKVTLTKSECDAK